MCGFAGSWSNSPITGDNAELVQSCIKNIEHRGPDALGLFTNEYLALSHARLAIVDLDARSNQPMSDASKRYVLAFNGEIYNYSELRSSLIESGVSFSTASDTEVLLQLLIKFDGEAIPMLNGCFAFVFYDALENRILAARDQMGINPLWFSSANGKLVFASELKGLPIQAQPEIDMDVVANYLKFGYCPDERAIYKGVFKLKPGHLIDSKNKFAQEAWFSLEATFELPTTGDLRLALENAVKSRLVADVTVGCFLSGGIDSSIIAALASKAHPGIHTFSIGYSDHPYLDESEAAEIVAQHIQSEHHSFKLSNNDLKCGINDYLNALDEPFADSSAVVAGILSRETRKFVKVALSGDGADELFGGYRKHRALAFSFSNRARLLSKLGFLADLISDKGSRESKWQDRLRKAKRLLGALALEPNYRYLTWAAFADPTENLGLKCDYDTQKIESDSLNQALFNDQKLVLPNDMLHKVDLMSMLHSLEVRVPFLDKNVVRIANGMRGDEKYSSEMGKIPLRNLFADLLPESVFKRPKKGFEIPLADVLKNEFGTEIANLKNSTQLMALGLDMTRVKQITSKPDLQLSWHLLVLHHWLAAEKNRFKNR